MTAVGFMLAACHSNSYKIVGTVEGLNDGDTLFLTRDFQSGIPSDTLIVKDGRFSMSGETDSVYLCMVYSANRNELNAPFFIESGGITINIKETPGASRVGGTLCNDQWQQLNDSVMSIGMEINRIAEHVYGNNLNQEEQQQAMAKIEKLNQRFADVVIKKAERNIDNEFGYFLLTYYPEEIIDNETRSRLIQLLPDAMKQRPAIQDILSEIKSIAASSDMTLTPFSLPSLDGTELDIMSVVKQNRITIIDFWASWCGPCRQEMPFMVELYQNYHERGLGIVGVSLDSNHDAWQQATKQLGIVWPQMSDLKGWDNAAAQMFHVNSIPHTIVVNNNGKILKRGLRGEDLELFVSQQLGQ